MQRAAAAIPFRDGTIDVTTSTVLFPFHETDNFGSDFTVEDIETADVLSIRVYNESVRYRYAGVAVTSDTGIVIDMDNDIQITGKEAIRRFSIIGNSGTATLWITLFTFGIPPA